MVIYYKQDRRAKAELPLWLIALDLNIEPEEVMWKCRGGCYKKDLRDPPLTRQIRLVFPSGTIRYQCMTCGSAVVFNDNDEQKLDTIPEKDRENYLSYYKHKEDKLKNKMRDRRDKK
jgi:hypothetical protein